MTATAPELLALHDGEHYRFAFDMNTCIGCHSCEVACAEQNSLPVDVSWRRVGEIEGGSFPDTRRFNLSMACNHCLEPTCLQGCPTDAYLKLDNGIVVHQADECIGCQYCTWNCPYSVPVFHKARKIVTKCDMCKPRLEQGLTSACVDACPTRAISIEPVNVAQWRLDHESANLPNLPSADITLSTTRIVTPHDVSMATFAASDYDVRPEHPHWPLVVVTLLVQLAAGTMASLAVAGVDRKSSAAAFVVAAIGLPISLFHLGRPALAFKALRGIKRSWLSREVLAFGLFAGASFGPVLIASRATAGFAAALGAVGMYCSARLYMVRGRPAWDSRLTVAAFFASSLALGPMALSVMKTPPPWAPFATAAGIVLQLGVVLLNLRRLKSHDELEWAGSYKLMTDWFAPQFNIRIILAVIGVALALAHAPVAALLTIGVGEFIGRYLFYVTVVPLNMPGSFSRTRHS